MKTFLKYKNRINHFYLVSQVHSIHMRKGKTIQMLESNGQRTLDSARNVSYRGDNFESRNTHKVLTRSVPKSGVLAVRTHPTTDSSRECHRGTSEAHLLLLLD